MNFLCYDEIVVLPNEKIMFSVFTKVCRKSDFDNRDLYFEFFFNI